jgi:archaeosortase B (VPXXXP-CTERM-specific)
MAKKRAKKNQKSEKKDKIIASETSFKQKLTDKITNNKNVLKFAGLYIFYIGIFTLLYIIFKDDLEFFRNITADGLSAILGIFGIQNSVFGSVIHLETISLKVIDECTGIYELLVYSGCVLAYSTTLDKKMYGIAFGVPAILSINMVRLVCLAFVGVWYPAIFDYVHYYLWQVTLILIIVLVTLLWIEKVVKR